MEKNELNIHDNPDAKAWAEEFAKHFDSPDVDTMIGWFANAIMAMHDHIMRKVDVRDKGGRILTCVYCGLEYPQNTPAWGSNILTEHIKVCEKHPLRKAEAEIQKLKYLVDDLTEKLKVKRVGEGEDEFRKFLDNITTDNICNEYVHGFNDAIQVIKDRFETYELHRKEGK